MRTRSVHRALAECDQFAHLSDELVTGILHRTPFYLHNVLACCCSRFSGTIQSSDFFEKRKRWCLTEPVLLAFGGYDTHDHGAYRCHQSLWALVEGHWIKSQYYVPCWSNDGDLYPVRVDDTTLFLLGGGQPEAGYDTLKWSYQSVELQPEAGYQNVESAAGARI